MKIIPTWSRASLPSFHQTALQFVEFANCTMFFFLSPHQQNYRLVIKIKMNISFWFYGISTIISYLILNPVYSYIYIRYIRLVNIS